MRLTSEVITEALNYINPLKEREIDLRGHKFGLLENLAPAKDADALDLTDNALQTISNLPLLPRLHSLYCARNRIASFAPNVGKQIPNLTTLVLTDNAVAELADLEPLRACAKLTYLSLMGCPVAARESYRLWVIWLIPSVRMLDFQKVKDAERKAAKEKFGTSWAELSEEAKGILAAGQGKRSSAAVNGNAAGQKSRVILTEEERADLVKKVKAASSIKEIERLEQLLAEGRLTG